jgi:hypothetical protein
MREMTEPAIAREELTPVRQPQQFDDLVGHKPLTYEQQVAGLTDQQILKEYEIRIQFLDLGCIVNVGCKSIAFDDPYKAIEEVKAYILNPKQVAPKWRGYFNMG